MSRCQRFEQEGIERLEQGLSLDDRHFEECPDCQAARKSYERLQSDIAALGSPAAPANWQAGVWAAIATRRSAKRRRTTWYIVSASGLAAAVTIAAFVLPPRPHPMTPPTLSAEVQQGAGPPRRGESLDGSSVPLGSRLVLTAATGSARFAELRVYRNDDQLVLQTSRAVSSTAVDDVLHATLLLDAVGRYQAVLVLSDRPFPPPSGTPDDDSAAARQAGARILFSPNITVR